MDAATIEAGNWWAQPRGARVGAWVADYQNSLQARHRTAIVEQVKALGAETLLEVGCHCGPNLMRLGQELPELQMVGVDISTEAIAAGRQWMASAGLSDRVQLNAGRVPLITESVASGSVDVVLSCYALAYVNPADLDAVLFEIGRLASKAVILAEPMVFTGTAVTLHQRMEGYREWAHPYADALKWVGALRAWTVRRIAVEPPVDHLNALLVIER